MVFVEYLVRGVGALYALGAIFLIRQMAMSELLDRAIAAIKLRREPAKQLVRRWLLGGGAVLTGASGIAALLMSSWAVPLFALNLVAQAGWLAWATTAFPPEDEDDALGRRRTFNAAFLYATVTATVFALAYEGGLRPWLEVASAVPVAAALAAYTVYAVRSFGGLGSKGADIGDSGAKDDPPADLVRHPSRIRFEVHPWRYPIVDADDGRLLNHFELLPDFEIADEIETWHDRFVDYVSAAPERSADVFPTPDAFDTHRAEGEKFVQYLRNTYGRDNVDGPIYLPRDETWEPVSENPSDADDADADDADAHDREAGRGA